MLVGAVFITVLAKFGGSCVRHCSCYTVVLFLIVSTVSLKCIRQRDWLKTSTLADFFI